MWASGWSWPWEVRERANGNGRAYARVAHGLRWLRHRFGFTVRRSQSGAEVSDHKRPLWRRCSGSLKVTFSSSLSEGGFYTPADETASNIHMNAHVFLDGQFVPAESAVVSVFDRGFMYGDGLFETLRVSNGVPFQWGLHWDRWAAGLEALGFPPVLERGPLRAAAVELARMNAIPEGVLRVAVSRGVGPRGYSPKGADRPTLVMSLSPFPCLPPRLLRWRLHTARSVHLSSALLNSFKTANRLPQILARMEAEQAGADEALVCDHGGQVAEAASGNVFWLQGNALHTPPLTLGALPGVARATVLTLATHLSLEVRESVIDPLALRAADGVFLSLSTHGVIEAVELDGHPLRCNEFVDRLWRSWERLVDQETRTPAVIG